MQVSVEQTSAIGRQVSVQLQQDQVQAALQKQVQACQRQKSVPGFRPGKVPLSIIQDHFAEEIKSAALQALINETLPKALQELSLTPVGKPELCSVVGLEQATPDLQYKVQFEIYPEVLLPDFSTLEVEQMISEMTEADVDKLMEKLSLESATVEVETEASVETVQTGSAMIRQKVRGDLEKKLELVSYEQIKKQILDQLLKACPIPLPQVLVEDEMARIHQDLHQRQGNHAQAHCEHQGLEEEAKRRVQLSLVFREIVKLHQLVVDEEKVKEKIQQLATAYGNAELIESLYYQSNELLEHLRRSVLVDQVIDFIVKQAAVKPKTVSVDTLLEA